VLRCWVLPRSNTSPTGDIVFESKASSKEVKAELEARLFAHAGKPIGVVVRTASEMAAVAKANPLPKAECNRTVAIFLDKTAAA
jgi:uncharacterized protein (DUF1697 family)